MESVGTMSLLDLFRIKEDESYNSGRSNFPSHHTLDSILRLERGRYPVRVQPNQTLLDIIRDEPINSKDNNNNKIWRQFKRRIRSRLQGTDGPVSRRVINPRGDSSIGVNASTSVGSDPPQSECSRNASEEEAAAAVPVMVQEETSGQPVKMSLRALWAEEAEAEAEKGSGDQYCCVCMVRHKGAAFIPCGYTFCRLCCREIHQQRGNCPLCNSLITEILVIF